MSKQKFSAYELNELWGDNQKIARKLVNDGLLITRDQQTSTPGIIHEVNLKAGRYTFRIEGVASSKILLFVSTKNLSDIVRKEKIQLATDRVVEASIEFDAPNDGPYRLGILFQSTEKFSTENPDQIFLKSAEITATKKANGVFAGMASIPRRVNSLEKVLEGLYSQTDAIFVHLNNYEKIPDFLNDSRIHVSRSQDIGDLKDTGKFVGLKNVDSSSYYFSVDDDIIYPSDYCSRMIETLRAYDNKAVVGVHGAIYKREHSTFLIGLWFTSRKAWRVTFPSLCSALGLQHSILDSLPLNSTGFRHMGWRT